MKLGPSRAVEVPAGLDPCSVPNDVLEAYELATRAVRLARAEAARRC